LKAQKVIPLLVIGIGLLVYDNSFRNAFIFDDLVHIVQNPHVCHLWPPWESLAHSTRPVVNLSLAANYALGGLDPWGYHLFNVGIHIIAALILYGVVRLTLLTKALRSRFGGSAGWLAGFVSLIWLVHPLQTESVTYVIQRGESLMGLFYLLTLYCVIRSSGSLRSTWWRAGAVASCALGMASKPVMVTAPLVVLLYDRIFLAQSWREVMKQRWVFYAFLAATWLLLPLLLASAPMEWKDTAGFAYKEIPPLQYALTQPGVILHYLRLAFWPSPLCLDYGWHYGWPLVRTLGGALPALPIVGVLLIATLWTCWRKPALGFLGLWFFMILAPTSSFIPVADVIFEHRLYLSLAAVIALVAVGGFEVGNRLLGAQQRMRRILEWGVSGALVLVLGSLTFQRNRDYSSELTIWQDTVVKCPGNPRAQNNLGKALLGIGKFQEAIGHFERAIQIKPGYAVAYDNMGTALAQTDKMQEAIEQFDRALQLQPDLSDAQFNMARALAQLGRLPEAVGHYEQALRLNPNDAEAHEELGNTLLALKKVPEAVQHWQQAVQIKPDYAEPRNNLAVALAQAGRLPEAVEQFQQVVRITPDDPEAHFNLANVLLASGQEPEAIQHYREALRLKPDFVEAQKRLEQLRAFSSQTNSTGVKSEIP
jgi:tetratricopeptide (TPR) repeat protein